MLTFDTAAAYTGEQNAVTLKIDISYWNDRNPDYLILCFETSPLGEVFINASEGETEGKNAYISEGYLYCPLSAGLTSTGTVKIQISAVIKEENGSETVDKTSVAALEFGPSIAVGSEYYGSDSTVYGEIEKLKTELKSISSFTAEWSFDYFASAIAARLLFIDSVSTPVYFPETAEKADNLIAGFAESFDPDTMKYVLVAVPESASKTARLCVFGMNGSTAVIRYYSGIKLLELLRTGVNI